MKVALTGASGFVGRHLLDEFLTREVLVRAVVRQIPEFAGQHSYRTVEWVICKDLFSESDETFARIISEAEILIHSAWYIKHDDYQTSEENFKCALATAKLARVCSENSVRFVGLGSCAEYGSASGVLSTDTPLAPETPYAMSKAASLLLIKALGTTQGLSYAWCRLFYLYGSHENPRRLVPYIRSRLETGMEVFLSSGERVLDFLDAREAARLVVDIAISGETGVFNVGSGVGTSIRNLAEQIADEYGRRDLLRFSVNYEQTDEPREVIANIEEGL